MAEPQQADVVETTEAEGSPPAPGDIDRHPEEWVTGDEPPTEAQLAYLRNLIARVAAGTEVPTDDGLEQLTKAGASEWIDRLKE